MLAQGKRLLSGPPRPESLARLAPLVNMLLVILLAHGLARLSWSLLPPPPPLPAPVEPAVPIPQNTQAMAGVDYRQIAGWHLFGEVGIEKPEPAPVKVNAPETRLNLTLMGIFYAEDGGRPLALIEGAGDKLAYGLNDELQGAARGVTIQAIEKDRVVLSRNGRLETLSLPRASGAISNAPPQGLSLPVVEQTPPTPSASDQTVDASTIAQRFRSEALARPEALQDLAFVDPYVRNGQFMGFRLRPGRDRRLLRQLGLRSGDVLTEVNGVRLDDPGKGFAVLQNLLNAPSVQVQVLRNGTEVPITFQLQ